MNTGDVIGAWLTISMPPKQSSRRRGGGASVGPPSLAVPAAGRVRTPVGRQTGVRSASGAGSSDRASGDAGRQRQGQVDVRKMINRLNRDGSPTKRQRATSDSGESTVSDADDPDADDQMAAFQRMLQRELQKQTALLTEHFKKTTDRLKEELVRMQQRVCDLEQHVNEQGETVHQLYDAVDQRDSRIFALEEQMEELRREANKPYLTFNGPGVPAAPKEEPWKQDVTTTMTLLRKYMPETEVKEQDIVQCYRVGKGKQIVCQFTRCGPSSVRDTIYDNRMDLMKDRNGQKREGSEQLYINEKLTPGAFEAYLNPRLTGGGGRLTPPSRIFAIAQKRTALST